MKAWRVEKHGGLEVLQCRDVPIPECSPGQVRIRVEAVGLNHLDLWVRKGVEGHRFPLPLTIGCDVTGVVESLGPGTELQAKAQKLQIGSSVIINPGISCGCCEWCLKGFDPLCRFYGILGETQDGGCAEFLTVPITNVILLPPRLSSLEAAAIAIPFITAWSMLTRKAQLQRGEIILIHAGGSGVSMAAIQMAKLLGAVVITTVGSEEKKPRAKNLGADFVINYKTHSFFNETKKILTTLNASCNVVIDHIGADTFADSLKILGWGGRLITCGATSGAQIQLDLKPIFFKNISILGSTMGSKADLIHILHLIEQGQLAPVIDSIYPFSELPSAMQHLESRAAYGKVVLQVSPSQRT